MKCDRCDKRIYIPKKYQKIPFASWFFFGKHYGYPRCCIINFVNCNNDRISGISEKYAKNGFVPCPKCCLTLQNGGKIEDLIKNRKCVKKY